MEALYKLSVGSFDFIGLAYPRCFGRALSIGVTSLKRGRSPPSKHLRLKDLNKPVEAKGDLLLVVSLPTGVDKDVL